RTPIQPEELGEGIVAFRLRRAGFAGREKATPVIEFVAVITVLSSPAGAVVHGQGRKPLGGNENERDLRENPRFREGEAPSEPHSGQKPRARTEPRSQGNSEPVLCGLVLNNRIVND